jgi:hypothetical protein
MFRSLLDELRKKLENAIANGAHDILSKLEEVEFQRRSNYRETKHKLFEMESRLKDIERAIAQSQVVAESSNTTLEVKLSLLDMKLDTEIGTKLIVMETRLILIEEATGADRRRGK